MNAPSEIERCPLCGEKQSVRPKLLLIDKAWVEFPLNDPRHKDPRLKYLADLRVDDVELAKIRERPLQQFVDGFYCDQCGHGFVSEDALREGRRRYK